MLGDVQGLVDVTRRRLGRRRKGDAAPFLDAVADDSQKAMNRVMPDIRRRPMLAGSATRTRGARCSAGRSRSSSTARTPWRARTTSARDAVADAARGRLHGAEEGPETLRVEKPPPRNNRGGPAPVAASRSRGAASRAVSAVPLVVRALRPFARERRPRRPPPAAAADRATISPTACWSTVLSPSVRKKPTASPSGRAPRPRTLGVVLELGCHSVRRRLDAATQGRAEGGGLAFGQPRRRRPRRPRACGRTRLRRRRAAERRRPRASRKGRGVVVIRGVVVVLRDLLGALLDLALLRDGAFCSVPRAPAHFLRADPGDRPFRASDEGRGLRGTDASGSGETASTTEGGGGGSVVGFGSGGFNLSCAAATQLLVSFCVCSRNASRSVALSSRSSSWSARSRWGVDRRGGMPRRTTTTRGLSTGRSMSWAMVYAFGLPLLGFASLLPIKFVQRARDGSRTFTASACEATGGSSRAGVARAHEIFEKPEQKV